VSTTLDLLRKGYDDSARGDVAAATEAWPDDFVLEGPKAEGLVLSGVHEGKEAALRALAALAATYDKSKTVPDEFIEEGDTIVVLVHVELRKGDRSAKFSAAHIWRFSNGQPRRLQILSDTLQTARVLGVV
jgi:ketosteroid isomerase-like protein